MKTFLKAFLGAWIGLVASLALADLGASISPFTANPSGNVTLPAPATGVAFTVNGASAGSSDGMLINAPPGGHNALDITGANSGDDRTTILYTAQVTSTQTWSAGVSTGGGTTKSFDIRDITGAITPFSIAKTTGLISVKALQSNGTTFTVGAGTGACATTSTLTGGATAGSLLCTGTAGASTIVINLPTAAHGWACWANDDTSKVSWASGGSTTAAVTLSGTIATTSDKVAFGCMGY